MKTIQGAEEQKLMDELNIYFRKVQRVKPSASRSESREMYFVCHQYYMSEHPEFRRRLEDERRQRELLKTDQGKQILKLEQSEKQRDEVRKFLKEYMNWGLEITDQMVEEFK